MPGPSPASSPCGCASPSRTRTARRARPLTTVGPRAGAELLILDEPTNGLDRAGIAEAAMTVFLRSDVTA
jgi:hypothetical protein